MSTKSIIPKSISCLLLVVMFYMHFCSALCATGLGGCCGEDDKDDDNCKKSCCSHSEKPESKDHDCQDMHFAFFSTTGQFASEKTVETTKVFHSFIAIVTPVYNVLPVSQCKDELPYNGFHPPPPKADLRIFIQSFQI